MLSPGSSQGSPPPPNLGPGPAAPAPAPACEHEHGNLHPHGSVLSERHPELDDVHGHGHSQGSESRASLIPATTKPSIEELEGRKNTNLGGTRALEPIPEVPTISVSAAPAEQDQSPRERPQQSATLRPPATSTRSKPNPSPATAPAASSWWKGLGMAFTGDSSRESGARGAKMGTWWPATDSATSSARSSRILTTAPPTATAATATTNATSPQVPALTRLKKSHTTGPTPEKNSPLSSFTSMLSRFTTQQGIPAPDDELCTMALEAALPTPSSSPSPEDYQTLQAQTLSLLSRFQTAYKAQSAALLDLQAERSAEREELAQVSTRARHLRVQLDDMLLRASEHEAAMASILEELNAEKKMRLDLERNKPAHPPSSEGSVITEDLAVEEDQRREGDETDEESIFSRSRSPTLADPETTSTTFTSSPSRPRNNIQRTKRTPASQQRLTAFQRIVRGISGEEGDTRCANCSGGDARVAWDTVSLLRDENKGLKQRVGALEDAVEGALDAVNGVGM